MKKKILLLAIMVAVLACLFAICVGAESYKAESSSIDMVISFFDASYNEAKKTAKVHEIFDVDFKNDKLINEFIQVVMNLINNTRIWENNGYTPIELYEIYSKEKQGAALRH